MMVEACDDCRIVPTLPYRDVGSGELLQEDVDFCKKHQAVDDLVAALREIVAMKDAKELRGDPIEVALMPSHLIKEGGWIPIHPRMLDGLRHASNKAEAALVKAGLGA